MTRRSEFMSEVTKELLIVWGIAMSIQLSLFIYIVASYLKYPFALYSRNYELFGYFTVFLSRYNTIDYFWHSLIAIFLLNGFVFVVSYLISRWAGKRFGRTFHLVVFVMIFLLLAHTVSWYLDSKLFRLMGGPL